MKMKRYLFLVMIFVLAFTAACGGGAETSAPAEAPAQEAAAPVAEEQPADNPAEAPAEATVETDFPFPDDASNMMDIGNGAINFQTALSIPDVVTFYRMAFPDYTEREILTIAEEDSLNLVFDGHESGKSVVIQGFPMGDGTVNVSVRLEDI